MKDEQIFHIVWSNGWQIYVSYVRSHAIILKKEVNQRKIS